MLKGNHSLYEWFNEASLVILVLSIIPSTPPWMLTNLEPSCDALMANISSTSMLDHSNKITPTHLQMDVFTGAYNPSGKLPITMVSCSEVIEIVPTVMAGVEYDVCVSHNGYDKDQYISDDIYVKFPSGSYAYQDSNGNVYKAWFGLRFDD